MVTSAMSMKSRSRICLATQVGQSSTHRSGVHGEVLTEVVSMGKALVEGRPARFL